MRTFPFTPSLAQGLQYAVTITQPNETIRLTSAPIDVTLGGQTFEARGALNITNIQFSADGTASNADIRVASSETASASIRAGLGARGLLDGLSIKVELFDLSNLAAGTFDMIPGATIGSVQEDTNGVIIIAVQGQLALLKAPMCEIHTVVCRARLGDARCRFPLEVDDVQPSTQYYLKDTHNSATAGAWDTWVRQLQSGSYGDRVYECTTAGTTGSGAAPTFTRTIGVTTTWGSAVFTCRQSYLTAAVGQALDFFNIQFTADPSSGPNTAADAASLNEPNYTLGNLIPRTGELKNTRIPIKFYDEGTKIVTTWQPFAPSNFPPGTEFDIHPGCDRLMTTCKGTYNNLKNMRATPYAPNSDLQTGRG